MTSKNLTIKEGIRTLCGLGLLAFAIILTQSQGHSILPKICVWIGLLVMLSPESSSSAASRVWLFARIGLLCNVFSLLILTLFQRLLFLNDWYESQGMMEFATTLKWLLNPLPTLLDRLVNTYNLGMMIFPEHRQLYVVVADYGNLLLQIVVVTLALSLATSFQRRSKANKSSLKTPGEAEEALSQRDPSSERYDLFFQGEVHDGMTSFQVGKKLAGIFNLNPEKAALLFSGKRVTVKTNVTRETADRFRRAFSEAGAILHLRRATPAPADSTTPPTTSQIATTQTRAERRKGRGLVFLAGLLLLILVGAGLFRSGILDLVTEAKPVYPKQFVGTWSNNQGEFKTLNLGLREDGRGTLATAMLPMLVRWEATAEGISLKATMPSEDTMGQVINYHLRYDEPRNTLLLQGEKTTQQLAKISDEQPEDLEQRVLDALLKRKQQMKDTARWKVTTLGKRDLKRKIDDLVKAEASFKVHHPEDGWYFTANKYSFSNSSSVMVSTTLNALPELSPASMHYRYRDDDPLPATLNPLFQLDSNRLEQLEELTHQSGFKLSKHTLVGKSIWQVEEFLDHRIISQIRSGQEVRDLIGYLLDETFANSAGPYELEVQSE